MLKNNSLPERIMVDCSHGNSSKDYRLQGQVVSDVGQQIADGSTSLFGIMIESNLFAGNQSIPDDLSQMQYGVSVTDGCIDWAETENVLRKLREQISSS
jgi:3-deoxy-7-phosphoheptulonate synthase